MKRTLIPMILLLGVLRATGQKPSIDPVGIRNWTSLSNPIISNDGKYAVYEIRNEPFGSQTLCIKGLSSKMELRIPRANGAIFARSGEMLLFRKGKDSLCSIKTGSDKIELIAAVKNFRLIRSGETERLLYEPAGQKGELVISNFKDGTQRINSGIERYEVSPDQRSIAMIYASDQHKKEIRLLDIGSGNIKTVWSGDNTAQYIFYPSGRSLLLYSSDPTGRPNTLWKFKDTLQNLRIDPNIFQLSDSLVLQDIERVSQDGRLVFLRYRKKEVPKTNVAGVHVWSYTDEIFMPKQLRELSVTKSYLAVLNLDTKRAYLIQKENDLIPVNLQSKDEFFGFMNVKAGGKELWNASLKPNYFFVSTTTGVRKSIPLRAETMSNDKRFIIGMKEVYGDVYTYEIKTGEVQNLTSTLPIPPIIENSTLDMPNARGLQFAALSQGQTNQIVIYDEYDIWLVDLENRQAPRCLTNGSGRRHKICFRIAHQGQSGKIETAKGNILLTAFNTVTKANDFYEIDLQKKSDPKRLTIDNCLYYMADYFELYGRGMKPVKAENAKVWIVRKESAAESPNYFWTVDFKIFKPVSNHYPEKKYNWLHSEIVDFKTTDGKDNQGILYKSDDFDPAKKYPVIFHYYTIKSQLANVFHQPDYSRGEIEISWFVSRGYVVFTPDIIYKVGETGMSAVRSVLGAARHLARNYTWIDSTKFGLQGHSFGGFETNFIITQTNLFAAAVSCAGISDVISNYGQIWGSGISVSEYWEYRDGRLGSSLPERPDLYINNSPILQSNRILTPLLIMHNEEDSAVPFGQSVELFTSMRRMGKKVWMLQYDKEVHTLIKEKNALDFTIRMGQFFDHYLMAKPMPDWMSTGVPARRKIAIP